MGQTQREFESHVPPLRQRHDPGFTPLKNDKSFSFFVFHLMHITNNI